MKIENVDLPCMCKYYIAERYIDLLKGSLLHADVIISGDILHCNMKYDETIFYVLKTILDKTEKITIGDMLKYEYELDKINAKDTQFDQELSTLETERSALNTEIDSIKQVRDDNVERTFGIFSQ